MRLNKNYDQIRAQYYQAYHELAHAKEWMETNVGERLRAHQETILNVLVKENGKSAEYFDNARFIKGNGAWAIATREGFEVIKLDEAFVSIRSLATPEKGQRPVTYKLDKSILFKSNRQVAKDTRDSVNGARERERHYALYTEKKELQALERTLKKTKADAEKLEAKVAGLKKKQEKK